MPLILLNKFWLVSATNPWMGGMIDPPNIIMIRKVDPWAVYLPRPVIDRVKIEGHMIEQQRPPLMKANVEKWPTVSKPTTIARIPNKPNITRVLTGFCWHI